MRKISFLLFLITIASSVTAQDYVSDEEVVIDKVASKFSGGAMPFVFVGFNDYSNNLGVGLEGNLNYALEKHFSVGGFLRLKGGFNYLPVPGVGRQGSFMGNGCLAYGGLFEFKPIPRIGIHVKAGYEFNFANSHYSPGPIYGGGFSLYLSPSNTFKTQHSFNFCINFEGNNETSFPVLDWDENRFRRSEVSAFIIQIGWRIQFYGVTTKK